MSDCYRGKKMVAMLCLSPKNETNTSSQLAQLLELTHSTSGSGVKESTSSGTKLNMSDLWSRPYSLDSTKHFEFEYSDAYSIEKVLETKLQTLQNLTCIKALQKNTQLISLDLTCHENFELSPASSVKSINSISRTLSPEQEKKTKIPSTSLFNEEEDVDVEDFDSDDSVKDKDYVPLSEKETSESSSGSEVSFIQNFASRLSSTAQVNSESIENEIETISTRILEPKSIQMQALFTPEITPCQEEQTLQSVEKLVSITLKAINKIELYKQYVSDKENIVVYQIIEQDVEQNLPDDSVVEAETDRRNLYTKSGNLRKRKKYDENPKKRKEAKRYKYINDHSVREGCDDHCLKKCKTLVSEEDRVKINKLYWSLSWREQRLFLQKCSNVAEPKKKITSEPKRRAKREFSFEIEQRKIIVCKIFLLTTLGYKNSNDKVLYNAINVTDIKDDMRGKHNKNTFINRDKIFQHIESFHPTNSHYRREHAPLRKYLPSDLSVKSMHENFSKSNPDIKISYDLYRKTVKSLNISFARLGHEECDICEAYDVHCKAQNHDLCDDCEVCVGFVKHKSRYTKSRKLYSEHKEMQNKDRNHIYFSCDLEKVIMLPRLETLKEVIFCHRLVAFNQTFAPVGETDIEPLAVLWHEAIAGRKQEDIISTFNVFFKQHRDVEYIDLWLDNCSAQNKNWLLYFYIIHMVNSDETNAKQIKLNYFEPGHTHMSADHFHHQVELSMKRKKKLHDFPDFVAAVSAANSQKCSVVNMGVTDFINVTDCTSNRRLQTSTPRAYIKDIVQVTFKRGKNNLFYKTDLDSEDIELIFLKDTYLKKKNDSLHIITTRTVPRGIKTARKQEILKKLSKFMPSYKQSFWKSLPTDDCEENED